MFELIIFIIIISFALKSSKKKNSQGKKSSPQQRTQPVRPQQSRPQQRPAQSKSLQSKPAQNRPVQTKPVKKEEMSTTEMLEAKALADDREEMVEKQKQRMENRKHYGHHNYAEKYILGDPVPKGKRMVFCSYCNAENLIPAHSSAKGYNCYFCREEL